MAVHFNQSRCDKNPFCPAARACPEGAMHIDRKTYTPGFDPEKCTGCRICISVCPVGAVYED